MKKKSPQKLYEKACQLELSAETVQNEELAFKLYLQAAKSKHQKAQHKVAKILECGQLGQQEDLKAAIIWYKKAAKGGSVQALYDLGSAFRAQSAELLDPDKEKLEVLSELNMQQMDLFLQKAWFYLEKAAEQGHCQAALALARMCLFAGYEANTEDYRKLFSYLQTIVDSSEVLGNKLSEACHLLGDLYRIGLGTEQNQAQARAYYKLALKSEINLLETIHRLILADLADPDTPKSKKMVQVLEYFMIIESGRFDHAIVPTPDPLDDEFVAQESYQIALAYLGEQTSDYFVSINEKNLSEDENYINALKYLNIAAKLHSFDYKDEIRKLCDKEKMRSEESVAQFRLYSLYKTFGLELLHDPLDLYVFECGNPMNDWLRKLEQSEHMNGLLVLAHYYRGSGKTLVPEQQKKANALFTRIRAYLAKKDILLEPRAAYLAGLMYHQGWGGVEDSVKALKYFHYAAEKEESEAQFHLGLSYFEGIDFPQNYQQALRYFKKLYCHSGALYYLALMHLEALGVKENFAYALDLLETIFRVVRRSFDDKYSLLANRKINELLADRELKALQGDSKSQFELSLLFYKTKIGRNAIPEGFQSCSNSSGWERKHTIWLQKALEQSYADAFWWWELMRPQCTACRESNQDNQIIERCEQHEKKFQENISTAAKHNQPEALYALYGFCLRGTSGFEKNKEKAFEFLKKSAEAGFSKAQLELITKWLQGEDFPQDIRKALRWLGELLRREAYIDKFSNYLLYCQLEHMEKIAKQQLDPTAQYQWGLMYQQGIKIISSGFETTEPDQKKAVIWLEAASNQGRADAQYDLAICYFQGRGIRRDHKQAARWFEAVIKQAREDQSFNLQQVPAILLKLKQNPLEFRYLQGILVFCKKQYKQAYEIFKALAEENYRYANRARYNLGFLHKKRRLSLENSATMAHNFFTQARENADGDSELVTKVDQSIANT